MVVPSVGHFVVRIKWTCDVRSPLADLQKHLNRRAWAVSLCEPDTVRTRGPCHLLSFQLVTCSERARGFEDVGRERPSVVSLPRNSGTACENWEAPSMMHTNSRHCCRFSFLFVRLSVLRGMELASLC